MKDQPNQGSREAFQKWEIGLFPQKSSQLKIYILSSRVECSVCLG